MRTCSLPVSYNKHCHKLSLANQTQAFNLIEVFCLVLPLEWWMVTNNSPLATHENTDSGQPTATYERVNNTVMGVIYSPLLLITAYIETRQAHAILVNRRRGDADDDTVEEWEHRTETQGPHDFETDGWAKAVEATKPNVETDAAVLEIRELKQKVGELMKMVEGLRDGANGRSS